MSAARVDYKHPCNPATLGSRWHDPKRKALHVGDDYKVRYGTPIKAIADGKVVAVAQHRLWGFYVWVEHADGRVSSYHQLQRGARPSRGDWVRQGKVIGLVGRPLNYLTEAQREADPTWAGQVKRDSAGNLVSNGELGHFHLGILAALAAGWVNPATVITTLAVATLGTEPIDQEDDMPTAEEIAKATVAELRNAQWFNGEAGGKTSTVEQILSKTRASVLVQEDRQKGYGTRLEHTQTALGRVAEDVRTSLTRQVGYGRRIEIIQERLLPELLTVAERPTDFSDQQAAKIAATLVEAIGVSGLVAQLDPETLKSVAEAAADELADRLKN